MQYKNAWHCTMPINRTLDYQMTVIIQTSQQAVEEYHQSVYKQLSLLQNKIGCMAESKKSQQLMTKMYHDKALDTFISG